MSRNAIITATAIAALGFASLGSAALGFGTGRATAPTPKACLVALDEGERVIGLSSDALGLAGEAVIAAATWNIAEVNRISDELEDVTTDLGDPDVYLDARAECRGETR